MPESERPTEAPIIDERKVIQHIKGRVRVKKKVKYQKALTAALFDYDRDTPQRKAQKKPNAAAVKEAIKADLIRKFIHAATQLAPPAPKAPVVEPSLTDKAHAVVIKQKTPKTPFPKVKRHKNDISKVWEEYR